MGKLDALLRPLAPGVSAGLFASMSGAEMPEAARIFLKCLVKTIVCSSEEASSLGLSPRLLEVAARYLDSDQIFFETGSLRLHLYRDRLEALDFHVDNAEESEFRMLNCWIPMNRVLPGQEIRMVPLSHRIGSRARRLFERLPDRLQLLCSSGLTDYEPGDVHLWSGDTEHGRVLNRHVDPAIAMVFRYAGHPLTSDWHPVNRSAGGEPVVASIAEARELDALMPRLILEAVELVHSIPRFSPGDSLRLLHSEHLVAHPSIGRHLAMCLIYYYERAGFGHQAVIQGGDDAGATSTPVYWPDYMVEIFLMLGMFYLQQGMPDKAESFLTETVRRTEDGSLLDKIIRLRSPALIEAMIQTHEALGLGERVARFALHRAAPAEPPSRSD